MLGLQCMCKELHGVNRYIEVEFNVLYFQECVQREKLMEPIIKHFIDEQKEL